MEYDMDDDVSPSDSPKADKQERQRTRKATFSEHLEDPSKALSTMDMESSHDNVKISRGKNAAFDFKLPKFAWTGDRRDSKEQADGGPSAGIRSPRKPKPILKNQALEKSPEIDDDDQKQHREKVEEQDYEFDVSIAQERENKSIWDVGTLKTLISKAMKLIADFGSNPQFVISNNDAITVVTLQGLQKKVYYLRLYIMIIAMISLVLGISVQVQLQHCRPAYVATLTYRFRRNTAGSGTSLLRRKKSDTVPMRTT